MTDFVIRQADDADVARVAELWTTVSRDLGDRGFDQWQYPVKTVNIETAVAAGTCWVMDDDDGLAATVTLDADADLTLWRPEDRPDDAMYVHRLVIRTDLRGIDLGSAILDWACGRARIAGKHWIRLDAWSTNQALHEYYLARGFQLVRQVEGPNVVSGVLLERSATTALGRGPRITAVRPA